MIKYLKHSEIDKVRWDECIANSANRMVYGLSWYLDIVSPKWDALILDDYKAVMPLTWKKKFGFYYLVQPAFCQQLGVFGDDDTTSDITRFISRIPGKYLSIRVHLNEKNKVIIKGINTYTRVNYTLSLNRPYEDLFSNYSKIHKKNIKTGRNRNITINNSSDLKKLYMFFLENHKHKFTLNKFNYTLLKSILSSLKNPEDYRLYLASSNDLKVVAAVFLIKSFERWILMLTPSTQYGRENRAIYLIINKFIEEHAGQEEILDFEGSNIKGVAEFFEGFGSMASSYKFIKYRRIPFIP
jgi:hypothetical protein